MSVQANTLSEDSTVILSGSGAAAILSAGIGSFAVAFFAIAADKLAWAKNLFVLYMPTGALSGETTVAILFWLATWAVLDWRWRRRTVSLRRINIVALVSLGLSLLLTFPPMGDLF